MRALRRAILALSLASPLLCAESSVLFRLSLPSRFSASAVGPDGSVYVVGSVVEDVIPVTAGAFMTSLRATSCPQSGIAYPCAHGFVARIDPDGSRVLWATYLGGSSEDEIWGVAVDRAGNAYVSGTTTSVDFPITTSAYRPQPGEGFVAKLSADGRSLLSSTYVGGTPTAITVDAAGFVFLAGFVRGTDFPTTAGAFQLARYANDRDAFVLKLDSALSTAVYSTLLGGSLGDSAYGIAVDPQGNAVVTGITTPPIDASGVPFPATPGSYQHPSASSSAFVAKLNVSGSALLFSSIVGGDGTSYGVGIALDSSADAYICGRAGPGFPTTPLAFSSGQANGFVMKLTPEGSRAWSTYVPIEPASLDGSFHCVVSPSGRVFLSGEVVGLLPTTHDSLQPCRSGVDAQRKGVLELNEDGTERVYGAWLRHAAALEGSGNLWAPSETKIIDRFDLKDPLPTQVTCVSSSASFLMTPVAPGEVVALFGSMIGPDEPAYARQDAAGRVAEEIGGVMVSVNGMPSPLLYAGRNQINAVVPFGVDGEQNANFVVRKDGADLPGLTLPVRGTSPAVFVPGVLNQDNTLNMPWSPAPLGSAVQIWGTGAGLVQPLPTDGELGRGATRISQTVRVWGTVSWGFMRFVKFPLEVEYAGDAPTLVQGVFQINARLPQGIQVGAGVAANLVVSIGELDSPAVTVWVKEADP